LEVLEKESQTPYFNKELDDYLVHLVDVVGDVSRNFDTIDPRASLRICKDVWSATKYLTGSSANSIPYEIVYALDLALKDWCQDDFIITTALIEGVDFHFYWVSPGVCINHYFPEKAITTEIIQIAFPRIYKHRPIYNVPLYHELGHFLDRHLKITTSSLLLDPPPPTLKEIEGYHRGEHFSDLFAAAYVGSAIADFLHNLFPEDPSCITHPATVRRLRVIEAFLNGDNHPVVDLIQNTLNRLGLPRLEKRFVKPEFESCFNNVRPCKLNSDKEVHGLIAYGWNFLKEMQSRSMPPWDTMEAIRIERTINNLVEKSIRNKMIVDKWKNASS
jgi:hypothetical protein